MTQPTQDMAVAETPAVTEMPEVTEMPAVTEMPEVAETPPVAEAPAVDGMPPMPSDPPVPRGPRRGLRAAARWTAAVLVFAVLGGATAYAVTRPERTHIPGLATPDDGRWTYPPLALPKLPAGRPRPLDDAKNLGGHHYVDVRSLLLAPPLTARTDPAVPGATGWLPVAGFLKVYDDMDAYLTQAESDELREQGLRHIAARSWTMPDGTRTDVYLLQFTTAGFASLYEPNTEARRIKGVADSADDKSLASGKGMPPAVTVAAHAEQPPYGATAGRYAWIFAGDTAGLVVQTRKGSVAEVPFVQTVRLQAQMLG